MGNGVLNKMNESSGALGVGVALSLGLAVVYFLQILLKTKQTRELSTPKGNSWFIPMLGESLEFMLNPVKFLITRMGRYGGIFSSHLFGSTVVVVLSQEAQKQVLASSEHHLFPNQVPTSASKVLGPGNLLDIHVGPLHANIRRVFLQRWKGANISDLLPVIDDIAKQCVESLIEKRSVTAFTEAKKYTFYIGLVAILGDMRPSMSDTEIFRETFDIVSEGLFSIPVNLPGMTFYKSLKASEHLREMIGKTVEKREKKIQDGAVYNDVLDDFMNFTPPGEDKEKLPRAQIESNVLMALVGANETTASTLVWVLKYLAENPRDLQEIIDEHQEIAYSKDSKDYTLTYEDILKMPASVRAFQESLRLTGPGFAAFRVAGKNTTLGGNFVAKGQRLVLPFLLIHRDPVHYPDPHKFNPSRFKDSPPKTGTFKPFSAGPRICPGADLAKVEVIVFLHRLVLNCRWELLDKSNAVDHWFPFPKPKAGLPIRVNPSVYKGIQQIQA